MDDKKKPADPELQGEGNYTATRNFDRKQEKFVKDQGNKIEQKAKDAERALEGPEGEELKAAEETGKAKSRAKGRDR